MKQPVLIDGYNYLFSLKEGGRLAQERELLILELNALVQESHYVVTLVFDGREETLPSKSNYDALEIMFSCEGQTADELIVELIEERSAAPLVVTNDNALKRACQVRGATLCSPKKFFSLLRKSKSGLTKAAKKKKQQERLEKLQIRGQKVSQVTFQDREMERWYRLFHERLQQENKEGSES